MTRRTVATAALALLMLAFVALGVWQVERRAWKLRLIAAVDARVHAAPVAAPWPGGDAPAYLRVRATGRFVGGDTLVQAVTERGPGFWAVAPLRTAAGWIVLVNRGFVPVGRVVAPPPGTVSVTGFRRATEPGGAFLRRNDSAGGRWFSRDVAAIARARGIAPVASYFIDADATPNPGGYPIGGLTVVAFRNTHLVYALTWFGLALLCGYGLWRVRREGR